MKASTKQWMRMIPCFMFIFFLLLVSVAPAYAATFTGEWTFDRNIAYPQWDTVSINFESNGNSYSSMTYVEYDEAYEVPCIKYGSTIAIYWRNGQTFYARTEFQYVNFTGFQLNMDDVFSNWMMSNAQQGRITPESEQVGQIKDNIDDAAGRLEDANNVWETLPDPTLSGDELDFLIGQRPEYQKYMNFWQTAWQNSTMYEMILALGGLMLASYLVFAGK